MYEKELEAMILAVKKANTEIMKIYRRGFHVDYKKDDSPVTEADLASNQIIRKELECFKDIAWLSEEDVDSEDRFKKRAVFIVDPLDGTQDFVSHDDYFGVNLALVVDNKPVVAVIGLPAKNAYAYAIKGKGSYYCQEDKEERMHVSDKLHDLIMVQSLTHNLPQEDLILNKHKDRIAKVIYLGASTKAIALAKGDVDASVRFTDQTKEWDVCAPDLIVEEAGGIFVDSKLNRFTYNRKDVINHDGYSMFNRIENTILLK